MEATHTLPRKTRNLHNHHMDSTVWDDVRYRDGDVVIATYGKSGTTWVQQIVGQLIFNGAGAVPIAELSPWVDLRIPPKHVKLPALEQQTNRRFLKTHLPVDALVFSPRAKYLYVARDGRDVVWSLYNHHAMANEKWYGALNDAPGLVGPRIEPPVASIREYFNAWLDGDGYPFWSFWENIASWWNVRNLPNVMFVHFNELKRDLPGQIRRMASFLDIAINEQHWPAILEHSGFDYMKAHAADVVPLGGSLWHGGAQTFMNKGTNARWRDTLSPEEIARYEQVARQKLGVDCAAWLETGQL